ncbi:metalloproteinase inhibitor 2-like isoform X2 [Oncorhynchus clarkii lewisi]|uniref:metalloproteinase inhibitor 2-like isoform X2 n=1 Tax=Oncorhynchus clarkii lewisi TaxID=490388 RepID=UPI0039B8E8CC
MNLVLFINQLIIRIRCASLGLEETYRTAAPQEQDRALLHYFAYVIRAKVVGKKAVSNAIKYDIQQIKMFKGCDQVIHAIFTYTTSCSVTLEINKEYLFTGKLKTGRMSITLCGYNPPWEDLSAAQKNSLTHRYQSGCDCKIIHCTSLPCPISTSDTCLWTYLGTDNGQNLACIKRQDGSCAWYKKIALPKK